MFSMDGVVMTGYPCGRAGEWSTVVFDGRVRLEDLSEPLIWFARRGVWQSPHRPAAPGPGLTMPPRLLQLLALGLPTLLVV